MGVPRNSQCSCIFHPISPTSDGVAYLFNNHVLHVCLTLLSNSAEPICDMIKGNESDVANYLSYRLKQKKYSYVYIVSKFKELLIVISLEPDVGL